MQYSVSSRATTMSDNTQEPIRFYDPKKQYGFLSNFYKAPFFIDKEWPTSEHYFQAQKFIHIKEYYDLISVSDTPGKAAALARQKKYRFGNKWKVNKKSSEEQPGFQFINSAIDKYKDLQIRPDWNNVREDIMREAITAKFLQNPELKKKLLETGQRELIEHTSRDSYWGNGGNDQGLNRLGHLLMELRSMLE